MAALPLLVSNLVLQHNRHRTLQPIKREDFLLFFILKNLYLNLKQKIHTTNNLIKHLCRNNIILSQAAVLVTMESKSCHHSIVDKSQVGHCLLASVLCKLSAENVCHTNHMNIYCIGKNIYIKGQNKWLLYIPCLIV